VCVESRNSHKGTATEKNNHTLARPEETKMKKKRRKPGRIQGDTP